MNFFLKYKQTQMCSGAVANKTNLFIKNHEKHWTIYISLYSFLSKYFCLLPFSHKDSVSLVIV